MAKTIHVTRAKADSARLLVETADFWGQPVHAAIRAIARAAAAAPVASLRNPKPRNIEDAWFLQEGNEPVSTWPSTSSTQGELSIDRPNRWWSESGIKSNLPPVRSNPESRQ